MKSCKKCQIGFGDDKDEKSYFVDMKDFGNPQGLEAIIAGVAWVGINLSILIVSPIIKLFDNMINHIIENQKNIKKLEKILKKYKVEKIFKKRKFDAKNYDGINSEKFVIRIKEEKEKIIKFLKEINNMNKSFKEKYGITRYEYLSGGFKDKLKEEKEENKSAHEEIRKELYDVSNLIEDNKKETFERFFRLIREYLIKGRSEIIYIRSIYNSIPNIKEKEKYELSKLFNNILENLIKLDEERIKFKKEIDDAYDSYNELTTRTFKNFKKKQVKQFRQIDEDENYKYESIDNNQNGSGYRKKGVKKSVKKSVKKGVKKVVKKSVKKGVKKVVKKSVKKGVKKVVKKSVKKPVKKVVKKK